MSDAQPLPLSFKIVAVVMAVLLASAVFGVIALLTQDYENHLVLTFKAEDGSPLDFSMASSDHTTTIPISMGLDVISSLSDEALVATAWPPPGTLGESSSFGGGFKVSIAVEQNHPSLEPGDQVLHIRTEEDGVVKHFAMRFRGTVGGTPWDAFPAGTGSGNRVSLRSRTHSLLVQFSKP